MSEVIPFKPRPKAKTKAVEEMAARASSTRIEGIDVLRGLCVAGMVVVAYAGDWSHRFKVLNHADWHSFALADMIFPGFLLCVGMAIPLSFAKRAEAGKAKIAAHIAWRTLAIIALGVGLSFLAAVLFGQFRIPGVLQRIGLCYGLAAGFALWLARPEGKGFRVPILP
ncbi:MAG: heparan-alpha-glucosaminide N-acetyltransferase domain-containing protein, partial [Asticcacaulis sp.]